MEQQKIFLTPPRLEVFLTLWDKRRIGKCFRRSDFFEIIFWSTYDNLKRSKIIVYHLEKCQQKRLFIAD